MTKQTLKGLAVMVAAALLVLVFGATALAQSESMEDGSARVAYCGDLSEDDCTLLTTAKEAMADLTSARTEQVTVLYAEGLPGLPADRVSILLGNTLTFVADPALMAQYDELRAMSPDAIMADPDLLESAMTLPLQIDMEQINRIELSPELAALLSASLGVDIPSNITYTTLLVDGVLYIRIAELAEMFSLPAFLGEWIGVDVESLAPMMMEDQLASGDIDADMVEEMMTAPGQAMSVVMPLMVQEENAPFFPNFVEQLRLRDGEIEGDPVANYRMTWDPADYFTSPFFAIQMQGMLQSDQGEMAAPSGTTLKALQMLSLVAFSNLDIQWSQSLGVENAYVYQSEVVMNWGLPLLGSPMGFAPAVGLNVRTANSLFDAVEPLQAPEGALVLPIAMLLNMLQNIR